MVSRRADSLSANQGRRHRDGSCERGFTLAEVAIAVAILGIGLATLITVQTRALNTHIFEKNLFQAALYGQYIMSFEELKNTPPPVERKEGDLKDLLTRLGYLQKLGEEKSSTQNALDGWRYTKAVTQRDFGAFKDVMREIELIIQWGPTQRESFRLVYAAPGLAGGGSGEGDGEGDGAGGDEPL